MPRKTLVADLLRQLAHAASMRPRPDAAENVTLEDDDVSEHRFNEAAARCRGKPGVRDGRGACARASMRPRPDAAENDG